MTLDPAANRYVKYIRNIRTIQVRHLPMLSLLVFQLSFLKTRLARVA